jgi:lysophospholipase L1-like esterase
MMKTVLCYGDSNTWGCDPATQGRHAYNQRWTTHLAHELGEGFLVIPEGLNGRTTVWPDPIEGEYKSGKSTLLAILESHHPLDLVVLMLGTNDLKHRWGLSAWDIARGVQTLVEMIQASTFGPDELSPQVLLVAPPPTCVRGTDFEDMFVGSDEKSVALGRHYRLVAEECGIPFINAGDTIVSSSLDGIHLDVTELPKLGRGVASKVREVLR